MFQQLYSYICQCMTSYKHPPFFSMHVLAATHQIHYLTLRGSTVFLTIICAGVGQFGILFLVVVVPMEELLLLFSYPVITLPPLLLLRCLFLVHFG